MTDAAETFDDVVIGAGAAGLFYGARAGERGRKVLVLDHAGKPAEKVRISGGGRCNFTNIHTAPDCFLSQNPHFAKSALARYTPEDFLDRLRARGVSWHEKTLGQLFCDGRSGEIIAMLVDELAAPGGVLRLETKVERVERGADGFSVTTSQGPVVSERLIVASGGLSIPKLGATGFAYDLARQFDHAVVTPRPALVPFVLGDQDADLKSLSGVAAPVVARAGDGVFEEAALFTHRGLSGPAMLQVSSYWREGEPVCLDLFPGEDAVAVLSALKAAHPKRTLAGALETRLAKRLAECLSARDMAGDARHLAETPDAALEQTARALSDWRITPVGTEGWRTAEVTLGGVDTAGLSSKSMESRTVRGLYFIGECVDVTGWLGGYNFQWAWASAWAAATAP